MTTRCCAIERTHRQVSAWVTLEGPLLEPGWDVEELGLEDIALAYMGRGRSSTEPESGRVASMTGAVR